MCFVYCYFSSSQATTGFIQFNWCVDKLIFRDIAPLSLLDIHYKYGDSAFWFPYLHNCVERQKALHAKYRLLEIKAQKTNKSQYEHPENGVEDTCLKLRRFLSGVDSMRFCCLYCVCSTFPLLLRSILLFFISAHCTPTVYLIWPKVLQRLCVCG